MILDPSVRITQQLTELYKRMESAPITAENQSVFFMQMRCEFVAILRRKKCLCEEDMAEMLCLPVLAIQEIEKKRFPLSEHTFFKIVARLGEMRESLIFSSRLHTKIICG